MRALNIRIRTDPSVYPPSEDTFLLVDALHITEDDTVFEVGCGSGYVAITAATTAKRVYAADISPTAVKNTIDNARLNGVYQRIAVFQSDLLSGVRRDARFDVIAFNPPYLPRDDDVTSLDDALIGGYDGTEIAVKFIRQAAKHISGDGAVYVVASSLGDVDALEREMRQQGLVVVRVAKEKLFFEELYVLRGVPSD